MGAEGPNLLEVRDLTVTYGRGRRSLQAVDGVSFDIGHGETVGLVGESGSGKSTIGRSVLGLVRVSGGVVRFRGEDITRAGRARRRALSRQLQVVFQDPYSSLNPARTVGQTLAEPLRVHERLSGADLHHRIAAALDAVGLSADAAERYPVSFSGGQRQRIAIARALMLSPSLVICDEPVSALDLSMQAQVINLLLELQERLQLSYLFISHDLALVRHLSHRILVLYRGRVMETGPADRVSAAPAHPYTQRLLAAAPLPDPVLQRRRRHERASEARAYQVEDHRGCAFAGRCPHTLDRCRSERPVDVEVEQGGSVACHRYPEIAATPVEVIGARRRG